MRGFQLSNGKHSKLIHELEVVAEMWGMLRLQYGLLYCKGWRAWCGMEANFQSNWTYRIMHINYTQCVANHTVAPLFIRALRHTYCTHWSKYRWYIPHIIALHVHDSDAVWICYGDMGIGIKYLGTLWQCIQLACSHVFLAPVFGNQNLELSKA